MSSRDHGNEPELYDLGDPVARIEHVGRGSYRVWIEHGITRYGPDGYWWRVYGRRRAERKARVELARYYEAQVRQHDVSAVTLADIGIFDAPERADEQ